LGKGNDENHHHADTGLAKKVIPLVHILVTLYEMYHFFGPPGTVKEMTRETRAYRTYRTYYALILAKRPSSEFFSQEIVSVKARSRDHMAVLVYKALTRPASTVPG